MEKKSSQQIGSLEMEIYSDKVARLRLRLTAMWSIRNISFGQINPVLQADHYEPLRSARLLASNTMISEILPAENLMSFEDDITSMGEGDGADFIQK